MEAIKGLYRDELSVYKRQTEELRAQNRLANEKNAGLNQKIAELQDLIEKASVANNDLHTAFEHVREENHRLQLHHDNQAVQTVDRFRQEPEGAMALEAAQNQYINLTRESIAWISEKDKLVQRNKYLDRECERYNRDLSTLSKQVRHLLKTLEEERGMIIKRKEQIKDYEDPVCSINVIDKHLVTFESIEELQQQNQKLLSLVKELSKQEEEREMQVENEDIRRLNSELENLRTQLEDVKCDRERIMEAFNTIMKERDLFKILLTKTRQVEHMTPEIFQRMVTVACASGPAISEPKDTQDKDVHIADLKNMVSKLEDDILKLRSEFDCAQNRREEELQLKTSLLEEAHLKILKESELVEVLKERNELLESNIKSLTVEFDEVRTRAQKLTFENQQLAKERKDLEASLDKERAGALSDVRMIMTSLVTKDEMRSEFSTVSRRLHEISLAESHAQNLARQIRDLEKQAHDLREQKRNLEEQKCHLEEQVCDLGEQVCELIRLRNLERNKQVPPRSSPDRELEEPVRKPKVPVLIQKEPVLEPKQLVRELEEPVWKQEEAVWEPKEPVREPEEPVLEQEEPVLEQEVPILMQEKPVLIQEEPVLELEQLVREQEEHVPKQEVPVPMQEEPVLELEQPVQEQEEPVREPEKPLQEPIGAPTAIILKRRKIT